MSKTFGLLLLSLVIATGCTQSPAGDKSGNIESEILGADLADSDIPADSYTRRVAIQGEISFGDTVEGHYASGGYAGWVLTANAGARLAIDAMATDGSDTVVALYGPMTGTSWTGNRPIEVNDDFHGSTNSHIDHRVTRAGTYLVIVREYWGDGGNFDLTLACSGTECRQECGAADACPTGSACNRVVCIRAPCPSFCHPVVAPPSTIGVACGGRAGNPCSANEYCNFPLGAICGRADGQGVCAARTQICTALYMPVCGCDGMTYSSSCHAAGAGTGVLHTGVCE